MEALKASLRKCAKKAEDSKVVLKTDEVKQLITLHVERLICFPVSSFQSKYDQQTKTQVL